MAFYLVLIRISAPIWALIALYRIVLYAEWLQALLIMFVWFVIHFILMTLNQRDVEWIRQGEQMRLEALRQTREQHDDW